MTITVAAAELLTRRRLLQTRLSETGADGHAVRCNHSRRDLVSVG